MTYRRLCLTLVACGLVGAVAILAGRTRVARGQTVPESNDATGDANQKLIETVGLLAGLHLYQTYLNIGFVADGKAEGTYEEADARKLLASVMTPLDTVDKQLEKVGKLAPGKADQDAVAQLRKLAALLRQQGKELETFWNTDQESDGAKYEATRKRAWEGISKLLALTDTPPG